MILKTVEDIKRKQESIIFTTTKQILKINYKDIYQRQAFQSTSTIIKLVEGSSAEGLVTPKAEPKKG